MLKAKEHNEKYQRDIKAFGPDEALRYLFMALSGEVKELIELRHVKMASGGLSCLEEINQKWNALRKWNPTFIRDGFVTFWETQSPELGVLRTLKKIRMHRAESGIRT